MKLADMTYKDMSYRIARVFTSCRTEDQIDTAVRYANLMLKKAHRISANSQYVAGYGQGVADLWAHLLRNTWKNDKDSSNG